MKKVIYFIFIYLCFSCGTNKDNRLQGIYYLYDGKKIIYDPQTHVSFFVILDDEYQFYDKYRQPRIAKNSFGSIKKINPNKYIIKSYYNKLNAKAEIVKIDDFNYVNDSSDIIFNLFLSESIFIEKVNYRLIINGTDTIDSKDNRFKLNKNSTYDYFEIILDIIISEYTNHAIFDKNIRIKTYKLNYPRESGYYHLIMDIEKNLFNIEIQDTLLVKSKKVFQFGNSFYKKK